MATYYMNEAAFDLPDLGFVDRTVTYLEAKAPSGADLVLVVERQPVPRGKSLRDLVVGHVADARKRMRGYSVLYEREADLVSGPAIDLGIRWRDENGMMYSRHTHLTIGQTWLIVAGEVPLEEREVCDGYVDHVLGTLRLAV